MLWSSPRGGSTLESIESTHLYIFATQHQDPYKTGLLSPGKLLQKTAYTWQPLFSPAQFCTVSNCWCLAVKTSFKIWKSRTWCIPLSISVLAPKPLGLFVLAKPSTKSFLSLSWHQPEVPSISFLASGVCQSRRAIGLLRNRLPFVPRNLTSGFSTSS